MAQQCCRWGASASVAALVLQLGLVVVALGDAGVSYPADSTWRDEMDRAGVAGDREQEMYRLLRVDHGGTFKQGQKVLLPKPEGDKYTQRMRLDVEKVRLQRRGVFLASVVVTLEFLGGSGPPYARAPYAGDLYAGAPDAGATKPDYMSIKGNGTFNAESGELCVLGCVASVCTYKLTLSYPAPASIHRVSTFGNISSVLDATDPLFFDPVSIYVIPSYGPYQYTMNTALASVCPELQTDIPVGKICREEQVCERGWIYGRSQVFWNPECEGANCSPFSQLGKAVAGNTSWLVFHRMTSEGNRIRGFLDVTSSLYERYDDPATSDGILITEGTWNSSTGKMCMIACRRLHETEEDCLIALTMQFPCTFTITQRSGMVGHIESLRKPTDPNYFKRITFKYVTSDLYLTSRHRLNQTEYVYTKVKTAKGLCPLNQRSPLFSRTYPSGVNSLDLLRDLQFFNLKDAHSKSQAGQNPSVSFTLFTFGDGFTRDMHVNGTDLVNVSYFIDGYRLGKSQALDTSIAAEGIYDLRTGKLCLIGCRTLDPANELKDLQLLEGDDHKDKDCQVFFTVQVPPVDSTSKVLKFNVKSLRLPTDPLHFKPQTFSASVGMQEWVWWRANPDILMSVAMLSLTVVFTILQLAYSNCYPKSLPYISTSMVVLLSLAHMIHLVLNFDALFQDFTQLSYNRFKAGGSPEMNEVLVRLTTMAAMLLQFRLLQLVWEARMKSRAAGDLAPTVQERRVLFTVVPVYIVGGVMAILLHVIHPLRLRPKNGLWWDMTVYGGVVQDFHLFPQVVGNVLWGAKRQAPLSKHFYLGMALVRSLPHLYDLYRRLHHTPYSGPGVSMYDHLEWDLYAIASDVLISSVILLLAILVFMQQQWGGRCLLPWQSRSSFEYEKVDITDT